MAHLLSTIQDEEKIVVLDDGRVVETGTPQGLLSKGGVYAGMYNLSLIGGE